MSLLMDALKKAEKEKKEAAKRRQTGQHPILTTGEHPVQEDDTQVMSTTATHAGDDELTQEVSLSMELQPKDDELTMESETTESTLSDTELLDNTLIVNQDGSVVTEEEDDDTLLTIGGEDIDLDLEDTQLIGEMTDETIIEKTMERQHDETVGGISQTLGSDETNDYTQEMTDELRTDMAEDNLDDETLGLKLETLENDEQPESVESKKQQTTEKVIGDTSEQKQFKTNLGQITDPSLELEALDSGSVTQMLRDIGQHEGQPTPVAASTVFAASKTDNWGSRIGFGLISALVLLLVITGGLFIHYQTTPDVPTVVSPSVAKGVEASQRSSISSLDELTSQSTASQETASVTPSEPTSSTDEPIETVYITHEEPVVAQVDATPDMSEPAMTETVAESVEETTTDESASTEPTADQTVAMVDKTEQMETPVESIQEDVVFSPVAAPVTPSMIKISRAKKKSRPEVGTNKRAYEAFQQGEYDIASSLYRISLREVPDNRDALLGMAAINLKKGNAQEAFEIYRKVLDLYPNDPVAKLSIQNMQSRAVSGNEGLLKRLIQEAPNNASLYSSLGNVYSQQQRWTEAQRAYFEAFSKQPDNPDYALNLAVSLDHMGQTQAALDYYQTAINLSKNNPSNFRVIDIIARIDAIRLN